MSKCWRETDQGKSSRTLYNENPRAKFIKTFLNPQENLRLLSFRNRIKDVQNIFELFSSIYYAKQHIFLKNYLKTFNF